MYDVLCALEPLWGELGGADSAARLAGVEFDTVAGEALADVLPHMASLMTLDLSSTA